MGGEGGSTDVVFAVAALRGAARLMRAGHRTFEDVVVPSERGIACFVCFALAFHDKSMLNRRQYHCSGNVFLALRSCWRGVMKR